MNAICFRAPLAAVLLAAMSSGQAAPVTYSIAFGPGRSYTPTGSFVYDGNLAVNQQFRSFTVFGEDAVYDFTSAANAFSFRTDAGAFHSACNTPAVNDAFELLTNAACVATAEGAGGKDWQDFVPGQNFNRTFSFGENSGSGSNQATDGFSAYASSSLLNIESNTGSSYLATAVANPSPSANVPEPASIALAAVGFAALAVGRRKRLR